MGQPRERQRRAHAQDLLHDPREQWLDELIDVLLRHEGHLDVELREVELPVRTDRLVAETPHDLVVAVQPRDHEDLLEELR